MNRPTSEPRLVPFYLRPDGSYMWGALSAQRLYSTLKGCLEDITEQADAYLTALEEGQRFRIRGNRLEILDGDGKATLAYVRQPPLPGSQPELAGTKWRTFGNVRPFTLVFLDDESIAGLDECHEYIGRHGGSGRLMYFNAVTPLGDIQPCWEDAFHSILRTEQYSVVSQAGSEKLLLGKRMGEPLTLESLPDVTLNAQQKEWLLTNFVDFSPDRLGKPLRMMNRAIPEPTVTLSFGETSTTGSAGCNSYQAPLTINERTIAIGQVSKTAISCRYMDNFNDVIRQELRFLELLPQVTHGVTIANRLFLSTPAGIYLIFEAQ